GTGDGLRALSGGGAAGDRDPGLVTGGDVALDQVERHFSAHRWFVGIEPSLADLGLLPYTRLAPEGGFDLGPRPVVRAWIARAETAF
ncbi:MAG: glutathione binding-like protein, partial [Pseudomonadota bacterium]|nr:glutathione binding-like protein [Pseudomonadota bacterium]